MGGGTIAAAGCRLGHGRVQAAGRAKPWTQPAKPAPHRGRPPTLRRPRRPRAARRRSGMRSAGWATSPCTGQIQLTGVEGQAAPAPGPASPSPGRDRRRRGSGSRPGRRNRFPRIFIALFAATYRRKLGRSEGAQDVRPAVHRQTGCRSYRGMAKQPIVAAPVKPPYQSFPDKCRFNRKRVIYNVLATESRYCQIQYADAATTICN